MAEPKYASLAVEDLKEGSNLFDNVRATITGVKYTKEAPDNYTAEGNPIFAVVDFLLAGESPVEERQVNQSYSLGAQAGDNFTISEDGHGLIPNNEDAALRKDCKWGTFVSSLQNEGVPKPVLQSGNISKFIGIDGQFKRIADRERTFAEERNKGKKSKFPPSTLCLVKLFAMPGEQAVGKPNGAVKPAANTSAPAATTTAAAPVSSGDVDEDTLALVQGVITGNGGPIQRGRLTLAVSKAAGPNNPSRSVLAKRAAEESFITSMVDLGMLTYGQAEKGQPVGLPA